jgi:hypothetical protein
MATSYIDYRGYRLSTTSPKSGEKWTVMINPLDALPALPGRAEADTRERAMEAAQYIVDAAFAPPPVPRGLFARLAGASRGASGTRASW